MKISLDWLGDYVVWPGTPAELADKLTCLGLNVEGVERFTVSFPGVVVAEVREVTPHPRADRLRVCQVATADQTSSVICGAPNVRAGLKVLLALPGARLPCGIHLKKTKIRGVESHGMICSASELELGEDSQGIMELPSESAPGTPADDIFGYSDTVFDIEVTPNRPDWLSHLGVAREVAALTGTKVAMPPIAMEKKTGGDRLGVNVDIEEFADCLRYTAHGASNLVVGSSPHFIRNRLRAVGARPINNVVDITNYVLFETGQPLHAFDRTKLVGDRIIVRRAGGDRVLRTLDGTERQLHPDDLVIADDSGPVAIAGIMGGESSEVSDQTVGIVLESAFFNPQVVRHTSRALGIITDSSYRFERTADWDQVERAAKRALYLLQKYAGAQICPDWVDRQNPDRKTPSKVPLRVAQVNRLLGTQLDLDGVVHALQRFSLKVIPLNQADAGQSSAANLMVEVPTFRRDLTQEVDLIEEVARFYGYENLVRAGHFRGGRGQGRRLVDLAVRKVRTYLVGAGYHEVCTSSFFGQVDLDRIGLQEDDPRRQCLQIANPHHGGDVLLRTLLLPSWLRVAQRNINADNPLPARFFQLNKVFRPTGGVQGPLRHEDEKLLPFEPIFLQFGLAGQPEKGLGEIPADLEEIKGIVTALGQLLRFPLRMVPGDTEPFLSSGRQWRIRDEKGQFLGTAGAVAPQVLAAYEIEQPVAVAELEISRLELVPQPVVFQRFSRYPAVKRDLSLVMPQGVNFCQIEEVVTTSAGPLLESLELFDFYQGKEIGESGVALGIRLKFRSDKGNLKGKTVDQAIATIQDHLADRLGVRLRS